MPKGTRPAAAWEKGKSPNPGGRPKLDKDVSNFVKKESMGAIWRIMELGTHAKDERVRLAANIYLIDRAYGKPAQSVSVDPSDDPFKIIVKVVNSQYEALKSESKDVTTLPAEYNAIAIDEEEDRVDGNII